VKPQRSVLSRDRARPRGREQRHAIRDREMGARPLQRPACASARASWPFPARGLVSAPGSRQHPDQSSAGPGSEDYHATGHLARMAAATRPAPWWADTAQPGPDTAGSCERDRVDRRVPAMPCCVVVGSCRPGPGCAT